MFIFRFGKIPLYLFTFLSILCIRDAKGQAEVIDSLNLVLQQAKHDTTRVKILHDLAGATHMTNPTEAIHYCEQALKIAERSKYTTGIAQSYGWLGYLYDLQGQVEKALDYNHKALRILESQSDFEGMAAANCNIGGIWFNQGNYSEALTYFESGLALYRKSGVPGIESILSNIGNVYYKLGETEKADSIYHESLAIHESTGNRRGIAYDKMWLALIARDEHKFDDAIEKFSESLILLNETQDLHGVSYVKFCIADTYFRTGNLSKAEIFATEAMKIAREIGNVEDITTAAEVLSRIYAKQNRGMEALEMYKLYDQLDDSVNNMQIQRATMSAKLQYEFDKKAMADSIAFAKEKEVQDAKMLAKDLEVEKQNLELKATRRMEIVLTVGLLLVIGFAIFLINRYRLIRRQKQIIEIKEQETQKQNETIRTQKLIVEEKNKEITDSIKYAKRIQAAVLPSARVVKELLPDSFIFYQAKDIVAGDFYWLEKLNNRIFFAAADCTGHGVPGAMVSVICNNGLNRSVREHHFSDPGKILDKTREIVIQEFEKSDETVYDGMDVSLVSFPATNAASGVIDLEWAGANNPLWIIRKGSQSLDEYVADKQPIGRYSHNNPFTTHKITVSNGDTLYVFTDGFADQFGGEKGKKFRNARLKELLLKNVNLEMTDQRQSLINAFNHWKGDLDQIDDVCLIGVRL